MYSNVNSKISLGTVKKGDQIPDSKFQIPNLIIPNCVSKWELDSMTIGLGTPARSTIA